MMKKVWLILLAVVLVFGLALLGCGSSGGDNTPPPSPPEEGPLEEKVVFDLKADEGIQAIAVGDITFPATGKTPISPLVKAGEVPTHLEYFKAVKDTDGKIALTYKSKVDWGPGIDLTNAAFGFRAGDKIEISGTITMSSGKFQLNGLVNSENATIGGQVTAITQAGAFSYNITLADSDMKNITQGASGDGPPGIRIECRSAGIEVQINQIKITGMRPSEIKALAAPVISLVGDTLSWDAISGAGGYAIYKDADTTPFTTVNTTSINFALLDTLEPGTYEITVIAKGVSGASLDSAKSNAVSYTKQEPEKVGFPIKVAGTDQTVEVKVVSGIVELLEDGDGYSFERGAAWQASYAWFGVTFSGTDKLSDFAKVKVKYQGVSGDVNYKNLALVASADPFSGGLQSDANVASKAVNALWWNDYNGAFDVGPQVTGTDPTDVTFIISKSKSDAYADKSTVYFSVFTAANVTGDVGGAGSPTIFSISDIEFVKETGAVNIETAATLDRIKLKSRPTKDEYLINEDAFDSTGLEITAIYLTADGVGYGNDVTTGFTLDVTEGTVFTSAGIKEITVTYNSKTVKFNVEVITEIIVLPDGFFDLGAPSDGWGSVGADLNPITELTFDIFKASKYLILKVSASSSKDGFGGIGIAAQSDADGWGWHEWKTGDWTNAPSGTNLGDTYYIVIELASLGSGADWTAVTGATGTAGKFKLNTLPGQITVVGGYLASVDLTMPTDGVVIASSNKTCDGWATKTAVPDMVP